MVQTFDFGSIEEMDPSVGELFATCYIHSAMGGWPPDSSEKGSLYPYRMLPLYVYWLLYYTDSILVAVRPYRRKQRLFLNSQPVGYKIALHTEESSPCLPVVPSKWWWHHCHNNTPVLPSRYCFTSKRIQSYTSTWSCAPVNSGKTIEVVYSYSNQSVYPAQTWVWNVRVPFDMGDQTSRAL